MSELSRRWQLRVFALFAAVVLWYFVALQNRERSSEKQIETNVTYNVPRGVILLDPVQQVSLRLRGSATEIRNLNPFAVDVTVDVGRNDRGVLEVHLDAANVSMPRGIELISIEPNTLRLALDIEGTRSVEVDPRVIGEPAAGAVVHRIEVDPVTVVVNGPEKHLLTLERLGTGPVSLDGHALSFEETVPVVSPDPLVRILQPSVVTVRIILRLPNTGEDHEAGESGGTVVPPSRRPPAATPRSPQ